MLEVVDLSYFLLGFCPSCPFAGFAAAALFLNAVVLGMGSAALTGGVPDVDG